MGPFFDHNILANLGMPSYMEEVMRGHIEAFNAKRDNFLKGKFEEKGFGHLIETAKDKIFTKIAAVEDSPWTYYYAENDRNEPVFICAIRAAEINTRSDPHDFGIKSEITFKWQDTDPLDFKRGRL